MRAKQTEVIAALWALWIGKDSGFLPIPPWLTLTLGRVAYTLTKLSTRYTTPDIVLEISSTSATVKKADRTCCDRSRVSDSLT